MAADNLPLRDEKYGHGKLPETFAKVRILPKTYVILSTKKKRLIKKKSKKFTQIKSKQTRPIQLQDFIIDKIHFMLFDHQMHRHVPPHSHSDTKLQQPYKKENENEENESTKCNFLSIGSRQWHWTETVEEEKNMNEWTRDEKSSRCWIDFKYRKHWIPLISSVLFFSRNFVLRFIFFPFCFVHFFLLILSFFIIPFNCHQFASSFHSNRHTLSIDLIRHFYAPLRSFNTLLTSFPSDFIISEFMDFSNLSFTQNTIFFSPFHSCYCVAKGAHCTAMIFYFILFFSVLLELTTQAQGKRIRRFNLENITIIRDFFARIRLKKILSLFCFETINQR